MIGKEFQSEARFYQDPKTGIEVRQLTLGESNNYHLYFTDNSYTKGGNDIYFLSDRSSQKPHAYNFFKMDLKSGIMTQITNEENGIAGLAGRTKTPDSEYLVYISGKKIKKVDMKTMEITTIYEEKGKATLRSPFISPDKKVVGVIRNEDVNIMRGANYSGFKDLMYGIKKSWVTLVYLDGSKAVDIHEDTHYLAHFQFAPDDSTTAMFCHEGPWNLVHQRIWLIDTLSREVKPCFRQEEDDCVGHEFWTRDGNIFFDNRRKGHDGTITSSKTQATIQAPDDPEQKPYVGFANKQGELLYRIDMPHYCNHYHASTDNTLLVGDEVEDLVLIRLENGETRLEKLCTHHTSWRTSSTHCHPTFSWDDSEILFASDRDGKINLYTVDLAQLQ